MRTLRLGSSGNDVVAWQHFLIGQGYYTGEADGIYSQEVLEATKDFQSAMGLNSDGVAGPMTLSTAVKEGFPGVSDDADDELSPNWPAKPNFNPINAVERSQLFGSFAYVSAATPDNPEAIKITDGWNTRNIRQVLIPQLKGIAGAPGNYVIPFHVKAIPQLVSLWTDWENAGLLDLVLSYAGSWAPRFVRGSRTYLSNHAWGTAFDINAGYNPLGAVPALVNKKGSVRKLVEIANDNGFYWGGHFDRMDGMHFEVAYIK